MHQTDNYPYTYQLRKLKFRYQVPVAIGESALKIGGHALLIKLSQ